MIHFQQAFVDNEFRGEDLIKFDYVRKYRWSIILADTTTDTAAATKIVYVGI